MSKIELKDVRIKTSVEGNGVFVHGDKVYTLVDGIIVVKEDVAEELLAVENRYWDTDNKKHVLVKPYSRA